MNDAPGKFSVVVVSDSSGMRYRVTLPTGVVIKTGSAFGVRRVIRKYKRAQQIENAANGANSQRGPDGL